MHCSLFLRLLFLLIIVNAIDWTYEIAMQVLAGWFDIMNVINYSFGCLDWITLGSLLLLIYLICLWKDDIKYDELHGFSSYHHHRSIITSIWGWLLLWHNQINIQMLLQYKKKWSIIRRASPLSFFFFTPYLVSVWGVLMHLIWIQTSDMSFLRKWGAHVT